MRLKQRVYEVLETAQPGDRLSRCVDIALVVLIGLNVAAAVLESVEEVHRLAPGLFAAVDLSAIAPFQLGWLPGVSLALDCLTNKQFVQINGGLLNEMGQLQHEADAVVHSSLETSFACWFRS